jgi:hypothetical protein
MDGAAIDACSKDQTTVTSRVVGIVLDERSDSHDVIDISRRDHSLGTRHLADGMRKIQHSPARGGANPIND